MLILNVNELVDTPAAVVPLAVSVVPRKVKAEVLPPVIEPAVVVVLVVLTGHCSCERAAASLLFG